MCFMRLLKPFRYALAALVLAGLQAAPASSYTVVKVSSASPAGLEESFIAATTGQFSATVLKNPYVPQTWKVTLYGPNPAYNPGVTQSDLLRSLVAVSTGGYVYGWADGRDAERWNDLRILGYYAINCSSSTLFDLTFGTTTDHVAIDLATCNRVLGVLQDAIYQQFFSTPTTPNGI